MNVEMAPWPVEAHFLAHHVMLLVSVGHTYQHHGEPWPVEAHFLAHHVMLLVSVGHAYQRHGEFQGLELRHQLLHGQLGGASHEPRHLHDPGGPIRPRYRPMVAHIHYRKT
jgi:hypothetical protein